ncbi:MAG: M23 family metallopeptidase [Vicinamibacterales bacterium]
MASTPHKERAQVFTIGAAYGFVAGVFAMALIVWQFGSMMPTRGSARGGDPKIPQVLEGLPGAPEQIDADAPELDRQTAKATSGDGATGSTEATIGAPPSAELKTRELEIPVEGIRADQLTPQFDDARGGRRHEAIDILAPMGTSVKAVEDGRIARLFLSKAGGTTVYQFDPTEKFCYYYAHLDRYAAGIREGERVRRGQVIGYVGVSGNAPKNTPHLHFAIFRLTGEKRWWEGTPLDPYEILR